MIKIEIQKTLKRVGTHDGRFHADEIMATAILNKIFQTEVVRSRNIDKLNELDIVYDVGGGKFDHHGINKVYRESGTPYAACGLIWNRYGKSVIYNKEPDLTDEEVESIFYYVDKKLIEGIDAQDNGVKTSEEIIHTMNISSIIAGFNPPWYSKELEDDLFHEAVKVAEMILNNTIKRKLEIIKAKDVVTCAYENRENPKILVLDDYCPWEETLRNIDEEGQVVFVVYPNNRNKYSVQTVVDAEGKTRKYLPKDWAGKENKELVSVTGVADAIFCHTGRFIAVAGSIEGIIQMAEIAIEYVEEE